MKSFAFPGEISDAACAIAAGQVPYMRTAEFSAIVKELEGLFLQLIGCKDGRMVLLTASGTGAMDAVATNYLSVLGQADSPVLIIDGGGFGRRWKSLCHYYHIPHCGFNVEFGKDADYERLEAEVKRTNASAVVTEHDETSSGQLFNLDRIGEICRKTGASLVVDAISSFLADPLDMEKMNIDICITSSQKGLNVHPGVSLVAISPKLNDFPWNRLSYYFDFEENLHNLTRGQTPYSPATMIILQTLDALRAVAAKGLDAQISEVAGRAERFRAGMRALGVEMPVEVKSNAVTGFMVPQEVAKTLFTDLIDRGYWIMPGGNPLYFRVSHLGLADTDSLISELKNLLKR